MKEILSVVKQELLAQIDRRVADNIIEPTNATLLKKLIKNADTNNEAMMIAELGTTYKRTGFHFDKRLEKMGDTIKYLKKNEKLSFVNDAERMTHKLIIGDNYDALQNLLISHKGMIDVIYIDPPYGCNDMGEFAKTNYENNLTRDNLLSMLYPRLMLAKQLLSEEGVIFCSIDDKNQAYVKCLFDEVFGEENCLFDIPRLTKKGGKSTSTIQKNHDYIFSYGLTNSIVFSKQKKELDSFQLRDEYYNERGPYKLTQTLDYASLQYSKNMDYELCINGKVFYPGGDSNKQKRRWEGDHKPQDWVWRWSKSAVEWGIANDIIVVKGDRVYTKTYANCYKVNGKNALEFCEPSKSYTTTHFLDNKYSNDNGKKDIDTIFDTKGVFVNPKPVALVKDLIKMVCNNKNAIILDFFAGSGTTGQAVMELNRQDGGNRQFILCTNNEEADGFIAESVTTKRLKRVMSGECYDHTNDFKWLEKNEPYRDNLSVYDIESVSNREQHTEKSAFDVIHEENYDLKPFKSVSEKVKWVCTNFENTQCYLEEVNPNA